MDTDARFNTLAAAVAELERVTYAQGCEIRRLHERAAALGEGLVVLEARLALVTDAYDHLAERLAS